MVTRAWLLALVGQLAKNAGVVRKPTRGVLTTSSVAARSVGRSQKMLRVSPALGARTVTIFQLFQSSSANWLTVLPQPGRPPNRNDAISMTAFAPMAEKG